MSNFNLKVLTSDEKIFSGLATKAVLPTVSGEITILNHHSPLISVISIGEMKVTDSNNVEHKFLIQGGVVDVRESHKDEPSKVIVLVDKKIGDEGENLDAEIARAQEAMQMKKDEYDFAEEEATIERSLFLRRRNK